MERLAAGLIRGPHGVHGFVKVQSFSGEHEHFYRLRQVYIRRAGDFLAYEVEEVRGRGARLEVKLRGVESPEQAAVLSGAELWVDRRDASPLQEGEYYLADLCRCRLYRGPEELGRVVSVCTAGPSELLEVEEAGGRRFLVPFSGRFVGEVDVENGRICVREDCELP
jgi:16S rRNA processing protein RimM